MDPRGTHLLADLSRCRKMPANAEAFLRRVAEIADLNVLDKIQHTFDGGGGETALLLLSTSHASVHTYPEMKYVSFDLYSCRPLDRDTIGKIKRLAREEMAPGCTEVKVIGRGDAASD